MIKNISIKNFRSLETVFVEFEEGITLIVGENDSGKSSMLDAIRLFLGDYSVTGEDFCLGKAEIEIQATLNGKKFLLKVGRDGTRFLGEVTTVSSLNQTREAVIAATELDDVKIAAGFLATSIKGTVKNPNTAKENVVEAIDKALALATGAEVILELRSFPNTQSYYLDGRQQTNVSTTFAEMFFKNIKKEIWDKAINEETTVSSFIRNQLDNHSLAVQEDIKTRGLDTALREYLPDLEEVSVKSTFEPRELSINVEVKMLNAVGEIDVNKKGDGTKRRITMALLEHKKSEQDGAEIYLFDEPDTHLHVRAQMELVRTLTRVVDRDKQVILTTHSPFLINSFGAKDIRLLNCVSGRSHVRRLSNERAVEKLLENLGIQNLHIFFGKRIVIVEGETEQEFIPVVYKHLFRSDPASNLISVIKRDGITDVPRFIRVFQEFQKPDEIFVLLDNDFNSCDEATKQILNDLRIPEPNKCFIGINEFEDAFSSETIFAAWVDHLGIIGRDPGPQWTVENIEQLRQDCFTHGNKFSEKLAGLTTGSGCKFTKPVFGRALAYYCTENEGIPITLKEFMDKIGYFA